jgi:hypothetical protein
VRYRHAQNKLNRKKNICNRRCRFIGANLILELLRTVDPVHIVTIDNKNPYYNVALKDWRLNEIENEAVKHVDSTFQFILGDIPIRVRSMLSLLNSSRISS